MSNRSLAQTLALLFGVAFLAFGVPGFILGITQDLGDIKFAGKDSPAELLGIFKVSILHNIVHLLFGVAGIALSRTTANAKMYLLYSGVIYIVLTVFGLFVDSGDANFIPVNSADTVLHLVLAVGLLGGWYLSKDSDEIVTERPATTPPALARFGVDGRLRLAEAASSRHAGPRRSRRGSRARSPPASLRRGRGPQGRSTARAELPSGLLLGRSRRFACVRRDPSAPT